MAVAQARWAEYVVGELLSESERTVTELDTLLGATPHRPTLTLEQVLKERAARMMADECLVTRIVAELRRLSDEWTPVERVAPTYAYKPCWAVYRGDPSGRTLTATRGRTW